MNDSGKAVFLSYASQDAEAARRICEALRAAGVEVWFDQSELVGGDTWDQKIRGQIKNCALFVPVISAATQARTEGYFRLEWRLADQRTHLMAKGRPFLLPVVIDDTQDAEAHVPDSFTEVQWTRLPGGETTEKFGERVKKLLGGEASAGGPVADRAPGHRPGLQMNPVKRAPWLVPAIVVVALIAAFAVWRPWRSTNIPVASPTSVSSAELSSARALAAKARALFESTTPSRDDFALAENYCRQALKLDENDAEVWAAYAELSSFYFRGGYDTSTERIELARVQAERAVKLAPRSFEARFAKASYLRGLDGPALADAEKILRELAEENPGDGRVLIALGKVIWGALGPGRNLARGDEALAVFARAEKIPGSHAEAAGQRGWLLFNLERYPEAEAAIDDSLRLEPSAILVGLKVEMAMWRGDLATAEASLGQLPPDVLQIDNAVGAAAELWLLAREPDKCLATLSAITRDYLSSNTYIGTVDGLRADAYQLANATEAARSSRQTALRVVDRRLQDQPRDGALRAERARLLALLDERDAAVRALRLYDETFPNPNWSATDGRYFAGLAHVLLDPPDAAIALLAPVARPGGPIGYLRLDFRFDALRGNPRFEALLASAEPKSAAVAAPTDQKSVAVLAFANLSDDKANEYFSDGISEELLTVLQKIPGLHVAARTSAFSFKGKNATAQEIGEKLGVANLVEGSVQKIGNRVKISARLSRAATGEQLWSENYTRDLADVFAVQSEIAQTIVERLRGQLTGEVAAAAKAEIQAQVQAAEKGGTKNVEAHELYLRGKFFVNQNTAESAIRAAGLLRRAVELDPEFALAWAALSDAGSIRSGFGETKQDFEEGFKLAREAADQSLAQAPYLAAAHVALADVLLLHDFDWKGAAESLRRASALAPSDPAVLSQTALLAYSVGQAERAIELCRQAVALDPINPFLRMELGNALSSVRRYDEAKAEFQRVFELSPAAPWGHAGVSMILTAQGKADEAVAEAAKETMGWSRLYGLVIAEWARGNKSASDAALAELIKTGSDVAAVQVAWAYAFRHDNDRAFEWLERAYRQRDGGLAWTKANFALESLHPDPRWPAFWKKIGLADEPLK